MQRDERSKMLGTMPMGRLIPKVSVPIMISMLVQALYNVVDSIFVARYDPDALMSLFESGEGTSEVTLTMTRLGVPALRTISLHFMIAAVAIVLTNVFQAIGKGMYSLIISLCRQLLVLLPAAYLLKSIFGTVDSVWWTFLIAEAVSLTLSLVFYRKCDREILSRL